MQRARGSKRESAATPKPAMRAPKTKKGVREVGRARPPARPPATPRRHAPRIRRTGSSSSFVSKSTGAFAHIDTARASIVHSSRAGRHQLATTPLNEPPHHAAITRREEGGSPNTANTTTHNTTPPPPPTTTPPPPTTTTLTAAPAAATAVATVAAGRQNAYKRWWLGGPAAARRSLPAPGRWPVRCRRCA